ncbi:hypothetical protein BGZ60DRAFT_76754 [Tricladium varicosporioides]|nr:hypothetical protein BGZ60DRAFT_76754 [Hymenoscyphus varicosporioides]
MEVLQEYTYQALTLYHNLSPHLDPIRSTFTQVRSTLYPILLPYLNLALDFAQDSPAIISVGVLILFLLVALQILSWIRRIMMWWFRLVMRLMFWGAVVVLVSVVWQRGVGRTVQDLVGWGEELRGVWWQEYRRWEGYQNMHNSGRNTDRGGVGWR